MILIIAMIMLFVYSLNKAYNEKLIRYKTLEEGQYIEYADNVFLISISDDKEYIIVDTLSKNISIKLKRTII